MSRPKLQEIQGQLNAEDALRPMEEKLRELNNLIRAREAIRLEKTVKASHGPRGSMYGRYAGDVTVEIPTRLALDAYRREIEKASKELQAEITKVTKALGMVRAAAAKTFQAVW